MQFLRRLFVSFFLTLLVLSLGTSVEGVQAAGTPMIFNPILPEDFSLGLFGADDEDQFLPVLIDETLVGTFVNLTTSVNNDRIFGVEQDSAGTNIFTLVGEDESGSNSYDLILSKFDGTGAIQAGFPVTVESLGGVGNFHAENGLIRMVPDTSGGIYLLLTTGAETGFGSLGAVLRHYNSAGTLSAGFPIALGDYNSDMITDGTGGVFVLSMIGADREGALALTHGSVEHYTSAGLDAAWAGGAGSFTVSSDAVSNKSGASIVSDNAGAGFVYWNDDDAGSPGIYGQRFTSAGLMATGWTARGDRLFASSNTSGFVRGTTSNADHHYVVFLDSGDITVISIDDDGDAAWGCTQTLDTDNNYEVIYNRDGANPGVFVVYGDGEINAQHFEEATGNSTWSIGGENVASGSDFDAVFPNQGGTFEEKASGISPDGSNGVNALYSHADPGDQTPFISNFNRASFAAGAGNDCSVAALPDAIADLSAVAGDSEVDLSWSAPAANGSPITDYVIEFREFPAGIFATFADGVSVGTSVTVDGLTNGQEYEFRVSAVNGVGTSAVSNLVQSTPAGLSGRSISRGKGTAPSVILGKIREFFSPSGSETGALKGSAPDFSSEKVQEPDGGEDRSAFIRYEQEQRALRGAAERRDSSDQLRDLMLELTRLFLWMKGDQYQPSVLTAERAEPFYDFFLTRYFHRLAGVEYLESRDDSAYSFQYRDPIKDPTRILADYQKSVMLTFGRVCFDPDLLSYAEEIDVPGYGAWFARYAEVMKDWTAEVLGTKNSVPWRTTRDIDVLQSLLRFLVNHCDG